MSNDWLYKFIAILVSEGTCHVYAQFVHKRSSVFSVLRFCIMVSSFMDVCNLRWLWVSKSNDGSFVSIFFAAIVDRTICWQLFFSTEVLIFLEVSVAVHMFLRWSSCVFVTQLQVVQHIDMIFTLSFCAVATTNWSSTGWLSLLLRNPEETTTSFLTVIKPGQVYVICIHALTLRECSVFFVHCCQVWKEK